MRSSYGRVVSFLSSTSPHSREYPQRVAFSLIGQALEAFLKVNPKASWQSVAADTNLPCPELVDFVLISCSFYEYILSDHDQEPMLKKFQNPTQADKIAMIEKDLDETKVILTKSIEQLLVRSVPV